MPRCTYTRRGSFAGPQVASHTKGHNPTDPSILTQSAPIPPTPAAPLTPAPTIVPLVPPHSKAGIS